MFVHEGFSSTMNTFLCCKQSSGQLSFMNMTMPKTGGVLHLYVCLPGRRLMKHVLMIFFFIALLASCRFAIWKYKRCTRTVHLDPELLLVVFWWCNLYCCCLPSWLEPLLAWANSSLLFALVLLSLAFSICIWGIDPTGCCGLLGAAVFFPCFIDTSQPAKLVACFRWLFFFSCKCDFLLWPYE